MINKEIVADLDDDILEMAIQVFIKNATVEVPALQEAYNQNNLEEVRRLAHKLKGSSIAVGLEEFSNQAKLIEETLIENPKKIEKAFVLELASLFTKIQQHFS